MGRKFREIVGPALGTDVEELRKPLLNTCSKVKLFLIRY
jgi:hypothetical protein